jgi:membrane fusion protein (multidrug efflux system)
VTTNQTNPLTTVQQLNPIYVDLTQSSAEVLRFRQQLEGGSIKRSGANQAKVRLRLEDGSLYAHEGTLEFTGVTVSETTGAITLRVVVPNPDGGLLPGMYVRAVVEQGVDEGAILAPRTAWPAMKMASRWHWWSRPTTRWSGAIRPPMRSAISGASPKD